MSSTDYELGILNLNFLKLIAWICLVTCNSGIPVGNIIIKSVMRRLACRLSAKYARPQSSWNLKIETNKRASVVKIGVCCKVHLLTSGLQLEGFAFCRILDSLRYDIKEIFR